MTATETISVTDSLKASIVKFGSLNPGQISRQEFKLSLRSMERIQGLRNLAKSGKSEVCVQLGKIF
jgi:hypothetical protein